MADPGSAWCSSGRLLAEGLPEAEVVEQDRLDAGPDGRGVQGLGAHGGVRVEGVDDRGVEDGLIAGQRARRASRALGRGS